MLAPYALGHSPFCPTQVLQNLTFTRMLVETRRAVTFMNNGYLPPPGFDGAKIAEGLFEAVPQSFLQTYIAVSSVLSGTAVSGTLTASIFMSFVTLGVSLAGLGAPCAALPPVACEGV